MITGLDANPKIHVRATADTSRGRTAAGGNITINVTGFVGSELELAREMKRIVRNHDVLVGD